MGLIRPGRAGLVRYRPPDVIDMIGQSGIGQIPRNLPIFGTQAAFVYDCSDATGAAGSLALAEHYGAAGGALSEAGGGSLTRGAAGPWTDGSTGVVGDGTGYLAAGGNDLGNIGTDDAVLVAALRYSDPGTGIILEKYASASSYLSLQTGTASSVRLHVKSGAAVSVIPANGPAPGDNAILVAVFCLDRSGNAIGYMNGVGGSPVSIVGVGSLDIAAPLSLLQRPGGSIYGSTDTLHGAALWHGANLFSDVATEGQAIASELTSRILGTYANLARGANQYPDSTTRASARYFQVGSTIHALGDNAHCIEEDADGDRYLSVYGEYTDQVDDGDDLSGWSVNRMAKSDSGIEGPIAGINWMRIKDDATATSFYTVYKVNAFTTPPTQNQKFLVQFRALNGDRRYITMRVFGNGEAGVTWDLVNGTISDTGSSGNMTLHASGIDGAKCWLVCSTSDAAPDPHLGFHLCDDGTMSAGTYDVLTGNPTSYPLGILVSRVLGVPGATGPVPDMAPGETKATEPVQLDADMMPADRWTVEFLFRRAAAPASTVPLLSYSDGTSAENFQVGLTSDGYINAICDSAGGDNGAVTGSVDLCDGAWHRAEVSAQAGRLAVRVDGAMVGADSSNTLPSGADTLYLGANYDASALLGGDIRGLRIHPYVRV